jgi:iron(III) transport system substrate-binding protein
MPDPSSEEKALPAWAIYKDEAYATTLAPSVIVYNKRLLAGYDLPTTHDGFLKFLNDNADKFKSKLTTYDLKTSGAGYLLANADIKHWKDYWSLIATQGKLGAQYYPSGGLMVEMIASGQYALGYNLPYAYAVLRQQKDPNMGIAFTTGDYILASSRIGFVAASAPHPNAGKLFLNYMLSKRGQDVIANQAALGAVRSDATGPMTLSVWDKQFGDKLVPIPVDLNLLQTLNPTNRLSLLNKWNQLGRNGGQ